MDDAATFFLGVATTTFLFALLFFSTFEEVVNLGVGDTMYEAYQHGHAVQCLGKKGYYWSCEGKN